MGRKLPAAELQRSSDVVADPAVGPGTDMRITGKREHLLGVRRADEVEALSIEGAGVRSLAGLERFTALDQLTLERVRPLDLSPLLEMPWVRLLAVSEPRDDLDLSVIERLEWLDVVLLSSSTRRMDSAIGGIDFGRLSNLRTLQLSASSDVDRFPVDIRWLDELRALEHLYLRGFWPAGQSLREFFEAAATVDRVYILTADPIDLDWLRKHRPPSNFTVETMVAPRSELKRGEIGGRAYVSVDLTARKKMDTNYEAAERLAGFMQRELPEIAARLDWDVEADEVTIRSSDPEALERTLAVLREGCW
jgi:hypothetical protein